MTLELNKIKRSMHMEVLQSFKAMLDLAEDQARRSCDMPLRVKVETWTKQWNRMTGDTRMTCWARAELEACSPQLAHTTTYDCD